jgi:predicted protein tyrosine phosphatase
MNNELNLFRGEIAPVIEQAEMIVVSNREDYAQAGDFLKVLKMKVKKIEEKRKEWTAPLDEAKKNIMADVKALIAPIDEAISNISAKMIEFATAEQKRLEAEQAIIEAEARAKMEAENLTSVEVVDVVEREKIKTERGNFATTTMTERISSFDVVDDTAIPREYLMPDRVKIIEALRDGKNIAGVSPVKTKQITSR